MVNKIDELDKKVFFNFAYINKSKKVNDDFLNEIKKICNYSIRSLKQGSRQTCYYSTIQTNNCGLPKTLPLELIEYVKIHFKLSIIIH